MSSTDGSVGAGQLTELCCVHQWNCAIGQNGNQWKCSPEISYIMSDKYLGCDGCFYQLLFTSKTGGRVLLRPAEEHLIVLYIISFCGIDNKKMYVKQFCRLHTNSSTHRESHPTCEG